MSMTKTELLTAILSVITKAPWFAINGENVVSNFGVCTSSGVPQMESGSDPRYDKERTTMAGWHCSSQNTSPSKLSYFFDKPILACVLQGKHIHQYDRLEKCHAPSLSTICHSSLA
ncbi:Uncharacterized protein Fot_13621 [Forsythia ovata]|uniref:Uncharacterized protein n=1 Tax=Forsythia ovata TaxID=205694 RepID=A0ABD1W656_9LAMI